MRRPWSSQRLRNALSDDAYTSFFDNGEIDPALARELVRRYQEKRVVNSFTACRKWMPA